MNKNSVGLVSTKFFTFAEPPNELVLESGAKLGPITLAYETYGELNEEKSNAILILHALSGDAHAAGYHSSEDVKPGWWDIMIGPGKAFNTNKYFVICSNVIGGCKGSTGPSSINPKTGKPYALDFPIVTIRDIINAQKHLIDHMGIKSLLSISGGSIGGMQVLQWTVSYPEMVRSAIPVATAARQSAQGIAFDEVGRRAIMSDPNWNGGNYYGKKIPKDGLSLARMIGHITYLSDESMHQKFGRNLQDISEYSFSFLPEFQVESYLYYKGDSFIKRFDANTYLYITKAIDYFDLTNGQKSLAKVFEHVKAKFLVISFSSDWLYPSYQSKEIVRALKANNVDVTYFEIKSNYGHDAFLIEHEKQTRLIESFLHHVVNPI
jgi:homoserine O-acetyltransferase